MEVRQFLLSNQRIRDTSLSITSGTSGSVDEQFHFWGEIKVHHVVEVGNIDTARGKVRHHKEVHFLVSEKLEALFTGSLVHRSINEGASKTSTDSQLMNVLDMVACGREHDGLLWGFLPFDELSHHK